MELWAVCFFSLLGMSALLWTIAVVHRVADPWSISQFPSYGISVPKKPLPFPSVTICPQISDSSAFPDFDSTVKPSMEALLTDVSSWPGILKYFSSQKTDNESQIIENIKKAVPQFGDTFKSCSWRNAEENCSDIFDEILTDEGLCFSSNNNLFGRGVKGNVLDPDIQEGLIGALDIVLTSKPTKNQRISPFSGFKIQLHNEDEFPLFDLSGFLRLSTNGLVAVTPERIGNRAFQFSDVNLGERNCAESFAIRKCEIECLSKLTISSCGCTAFFMPRMDESLPICRDNQCTDEIFRKSRLTSASRECGCPTACTQVVYHIEAVQHELDRSSADFNSSILASHLIVYINPGLSLSYSKTIHYSFPEITTGVPDYTVLLFSGLFFVVFSILTWHHGMQVFHHHSQEIVL